MNALVRSHRLRPVLRLLPCVGLRFFILRVTGYGALRNWQGSDPFPDGRAQDQLLIFCGYPGEVDAANNGSEQSCGPV